MKIFYLSFTLAVAVLSPVTAYAGPTGIFGPTNPIVPEMCQCENQIGPEGQVLQTAPDFGCVLQVVQNVISFAISLAVIVLVLFLAYAGFKMIVSRGNPSGIEEARTRLMNAVIGLVLILAAWAIIDFVMKAVTDQGELGPWNTLLVNSESNRCLVAKKPDSIISGNLTLTPADPSTGGSGANGTRGGTAGGSHMQGTRGCPNCTSLTSAGLSCQARHCSADPRLVQKLQALKDNYTGSWTITEGYPPSRRHQNACHSMGTCVDADFFGNANYTVPNFRAFGNAARSAGIRAVFESSNCQEVERARRAGVEAACYPPTVISGSHFSLYGQQ